MTVPGRATDTCPSTTVRPASSGCCWPSYPGPFGGGSRTSSSGSGARKGPIPATGRRLGAGSGTRRHASRTPSPPDCARDCVRSGDRDRTATKTERGRGRWGEWRRMSGTRPGRWPASRCTRPWRSPRWRSGSVRTRPSSTWSTASCSGPFPTTPPTSSMPCTRSGPPLPQPRGPTSRTGKDGRTSSRGSPAPSSTAPTRSGTTRQSNSRRARCHATPWGCWAWSPCSAGPSRPTRTATVGSTPSS